MLAWKGKVETCEVSRLRHTFASLLLQQAANVKYIQQQLGHSSISITLDVYSHLFEGDHRHQVQRLDDVVEKTDLADLNKAESAPPPHRRVEGSKWEKTEVAEIMEKLSVGGVTEWPNVPVLKTDKDSSEPQ